MRVGSRNRSRQLSGMSRSIIDHCQMFPVPWNSRLFSPFMQTATGGTKT
jgi:hypothetical protein